MVEKRGGEILPPDSTKKEKSVDESSEVISQRVSARWQELVQQGLNIDDACDQARREIVPQGRQHEAYSKDRDKMIISLGPTLSETLPLFEKQHPRVLEAIREIKERLSKVKVVPLGPKQIAQRFGGTQDQAELSIAIGRYETVAGSLLADAKTYEFELNEYKKEKDPRLSVDNRLAHATTCYNLGKRLIRSVENTHGWVSADGRRKLSYLDIACGQKGVLDAKW